ncbi:MAG: GNAT family N-acetyltransferase [Candidatus Odinarchaeia archaeon]
METKDGDIKKYKKEVVNILKQLKLEDFHEKSKIGISDQDGKKVSEFVPIGLSAKDNVEIIKLLARWRSENMDAYPTQFPVTDEGTQRWIYNQLIEREDRILFFIQRLNGCKIGHIGLSEFNFLERSCEIDNVVRGEKNIMKGIMTFALNTLLDWSIRKLKLKKIYLRVFLDNTRAIALYKRCGFKELEKIPLEREIEGDVIKYLEKKDNLKADRYFLKMLWIPK